MTEQEVVFDFSKTQEQLADKRAKQAQRKQAAIDSSYIKRRGEVLAKAKEKTRLNRPEERLRNAWQHAFDQLPPEEQQRIDDLNLDYRVALGQAIETIADIAKNRFDSGKPSPDQTYRFVADFVSQTGRGEAFSDLFLLANLSADDFEAATASDPDICFYGRPTKLNGLIFDVLANSVWQWSQLNKSDCDPTVYAELEAQFPQPEVQPVPAQPIGYRNSTKREENAIAATKEFTQQQQRIMQQGV